MALAAGMCFLPPNELALLCIHWQNILLSKKDPLCHVLSGEPRGFLMSVCWQGLGSWQRWCGLLPIDPASADGGGAAPFTLRLTRLKCRHPVSPRC